MNSNDPNANKRFGFSGRPKLQIPRSAVEKGLEALTIIGFLFSLFLIYRCWNLLPERIPSHYNFEGHPDGWSIKETLFIFPGVIFIIFTAISVLERFPNIYNYAFQLTEKNISRQYFLARNLLGWLKFEIAWFFAYIEWKTIEVSMGQARGLGPAFVFIFLAFIFGSVAVYFWQAYRAR